MIFEHTFAAGGVERVALAVEDLSAFGGGDAGVPDEAHVGVFSKTPLSTYFIVRRLFRGCRDEKVSDPGVRGVLGEGHEKQVIFVAEPTVRLPFPEGSRGP